MLLNLNIENRTQEFEEIYQSLNQDVKDLPDLKLLERFIEFVAIGNYNNAIELYAGSSVEYRNVIEQIMELKKYE